MEEKEIAFEICVILQSYGFKAVYAGGCVRDSLSLMSYNDIDIATSASSKNVMKILSQNDYFVKEVGESFSVVLAKKDSHEFEIASFRKDIDCDGRHPKSIEFATIEEDAQRRDFTINAVFYDPIMKEHIDFVDGIKDIENKTLRFVGKLEERCAEDYLRILRFVRFWSKGYIPSEEDISKVDNLSENILKYVAPERIMKELNEKVLPNKEIVINFFKNLEKMPKLFNVLFPELYALKGVEQNPEHHPEGDAFVHSMMVFETLVSWNENPLCILAGLFHDLGKKKTTKITGGKITSHKHEVESAILTKNIMERYKFPNHNIDYVVGLVEDHMKLHHKGMKLSSLRKLMAKDYFHDLIGLVYADIESSNGDFSVIDNYVEEIDSIRKKYTSVLPKPLVNGYDLITLGLTPGENFKIILDKVFEAQLDGSFYKKEEAIKFTEEIISTMNERSKK